MPNRLTKGKALIGSVAASSIAIGGGTPIKKVTVGTIAINPASLATLTKAATTFTLTGAAAGDVVLMVPPAALEDDLIPAGSVVTATDTVSVYLYNASAGPVDGASLTWTYIWYDLT